MECTICKKEYCCHGRQLRNGNKWECSDCGESGEGGSYTYAIAMYEGKVVNPDTTEDWGGFDVCKDCYDKYTIK